MVIHLRKNPCFHRTFEPQKKLKSRFFLSKPVILKFFLVDTPPSFLLSFGVYGEWVMENGGP